MASRRRMSVGENLTSKGVSASGEILDDWEKIVKICNAGKAADFYSVGDYKNISLGSEGTIPFVLGGFNMECRSDGRGFASTTWIAGKVLASKVAYGTFASTKPMEYPSSNLRNFLYNTVLNLFPEEIKNNIVPVLKHISWAIDYSNYWSKGRNGYTFEATARSSETLWVLSIGEILLPANLGGYGAVADKTYSLSGNDIQSWVSIGNIGSNSSSGPQAPFFEYFAMGAGYMASTHPAKDKYSVRFAFCL